MRPWGVGQVGGGCLGWSTIVYMSSGMFRGKESSNRIELSWLVQELSNFSVFGFLRLLGVGGGWMGGSWGVGGWGGGWRVPPTYMHMHVHACTSTHALACVVNMVISCKWPPPLDLGKSQGFPMMSYTCVHVHACMCMCMWVGCTLSPPPTPIYPPPHPPGGDPRNHSKFNSTWTNRDISILFEDLKSVETPPPMGGCIIWWVGVWVGGLMGGVRSNH